MLVYLSHPAITSCHGVASRRGIVLLLEFANPVSTKMLVFFLVLAMVASVVMMLRVEYADDPNKYYQ